MSDNESVSAAYRKCRDLPDIIPRDKRGYILGKIYTVSLNDEKTTIKDVFRSECFEIGEKFTDISSNLEAMVQSVKEVIYLQ